MISLRVRKGRYDQATAARVSYWLAHGDFDPEMVVCHQCDNTLCVNPNHLYLDTWSNRMATKTQKGRQSKGEDHAPAKLTEQQVQAILDDTKHSNIQLANIYNCAFNTIRQIKTRKIWSHLTRDTTYEPIHTPIEPTNNPIVQKVPNKNKRRPLTDDQVRAIRASTQSASSLAKLYGVAQSTISMIRHNYIYRDVK